MIFLSIYTVAVTGTGTILAGATFYDACRAARMEGAYIVRMYPNARPVTVAFCDAGTVKPTVNAGTDERADLG